jgi:hypothetical protein
MVEKAARPYPALEAEIPPDVGCPVTFPDVDVLVSILRQARAIGEGKSAAITIERSRGRISYASHHELLGRYFTEVPPSPSLSVTDEETRPVPLNRPYPGYTEDARRNRVQGIIRASALVDPGGFVNEVKTPEPSARRSRSGGYTRDSRDAIQARD